MAQGRRSAFVLALLLVAWVSPALVAGFHRTSPFLEGMRRVAGLAPIRPGSASQERLREFLAQSRERLPPRSEVAVWIERMPRDPAEVASQGFVWITAAYLLYPRRVFLLSTPEVTLELVQDLETRQLIGPPLAALLSARAAALASNELSQPMSILVWSPSADCQVETFGAWPAIRFLIAFPQGGCLFAADGEK